MPACSTTSERAWPSCTALSRFKGYLIKDRHMCQMALFSVSSCAHALSEIICLTDHSHWPTTCQLELKWVSSRNRCGIFSKVSTPLALCLSGIRLAQVRRSREHLDNYYVVFSILDFRREDFKNSPVAFDQLWSANTQHWCLRPIYTLLSRSRNLSHDAGAFTVKQQLRPS